MDSSAVYELFEELIQKVDEMSKKTIPDNQTDSTSDPGTNFTYRRFTNQD